MIGLELDFRKLMASGRVLILTGLLQYPLCVLFGCSRRASSWTR